MTQERADDIVVEYREAMGEYEKLKIAAHQTIVASNEAAVRAQRATKKMRKLLEQAEITLTDAEVLEGVPTIPEAVVG